MTKFGVWALLLCLGPLSISAQSIAVLSADESSGHIHQTAESEHLQQLWQDVLRRNPPGIHLRSAQKLIWPVHQAGSFSYLDIFALGAYVDHDDRYPNHLLDYQCGTFTTDGENGNHTGTDIVLWPFGWQQMDRNQAQVIAAAAGEIIEKIDGQYDRNCPFRFVTGRGNAVFVRHDDGNTALYLNLKQGSLTDKLVGARVEQGEYLGIVGSSGNSFYPHLHFELRSPSGAIIDPFTGPCNPGESYWEEQRPYLESGVNLLSTSLQRPNFNNLCDPADYTIQETFAAGDSLYFIAFARQTKSGQPIRMRVLRPDSTALTDRSRSIDRNSTRAYFVHAVTLPESAPSGTYTCILSYLDREYRTTFQVQGKDCPLPNISDLTAEILNAQEARLTYNGPDASRYQWQIRRQGATAWTDIPTEAHSFYLRGLQASTTYEYRMRYWCQDTWSAWSSVAQFVTPADASCPPVPLNQTAVTFPSLTAATIAIELPGKNRYDWRIRPPDDQWYNVISQTDSTYTFEGLIANTTYQYRVRVRCGSVWSSWSDVGSFTTPAAAPCDPPTTNDFSATAVSSTEVLLKALVENKERYDWRLRPTGSTTWITIPSTTTPDLVLQGLTPGISYDIQHRWICTDAWSEWSGTLLYASPPTPCPDLAAADLSVSFPEEGFADITVTLDESRTAYQFRYRLIGAANWTTLSASSAATTRIPLLSGEEYQVQARTFCNDNWSNWSISLTFTAPLIVVCPDVPLDSTSVDLLSPTSVRLAVAAPAESDVIDVRFRKNNSTTWSQLGNSPGIDFQLTQLSPSTTYAFEVRGRCGDEVTPWSNTGFFTTSSQPVCLTPDTTDFSAQVLSDQEIQLMVTVDTAQEYQWRYRAESANAWILLPATVSPQAMLSELTGNQRYAIQLRQECTNNVWSNWSPSLWRRTESPYLCPTPETEDITAFDVQHDRATLLYTGGEGLIFEWRFRVSGQPTWTLSTDSIEPVRTIRQLTAATTYDYQLRIDCGQGWSDWSDSQNFTTLPPPPPCAAPTTNQINIVLLPTIQAVRVFVEGISTDRYQWRLRRTGQTTWSQTGESTENNWLTDQLAGEADYELQIRVRCNGSWTSWSSLQQFTTPVHVTCEDPGNTQLTVSNISEQSALVQVSAAGALTFSVQYRSQGTTTWTTAGPQTDSLFSLVGLLPETGYEVRFRYACEAGASSWSPIITFTTLVLEVCPDPPLANITISDTAATSLTFHILNTEAPEFQVQFRRADVEMWAGTLQRTHVEIPLNNLEPETTYAYRFRYECPAGWSTWSPVGTVTTLPFIPGPCLQPLVDNRRAGLSHVLMEWTATAENDRYEVRFRDIYAPQWQIYDNLSDTILAIAGLEPCTAYEWQVRTVCDTSRTSEWSSVRSISTIGCSALYCYSYGLGETAFIEAVTINGIRHESGNDYGYANYTFKENRITAGETLELQLAGALPSDTLQADEFYWRIWLDRNQDGDFQDSAELIWETTTLPEEHLDLLFDPDLKASSKPYRLRLGLSKERYPQVCAVESDKYIEDYQLYVDLAQEPIPLPGDKEGNNSKMTIPLAVRPALPDDGFVHQPFPNPFSDQVNIPLTIAENGTLQWHLFNAHGKLMQKQQHVLPRGQHTLSISGNNLPAGYYTLSIQTDRQRKTIRLIKTE